METLNYFAAYFNKFYILGFLAPTWINFIKNLIKHNLFSRLGETSCGGIFYRAEMEESAEIFRHPINNFHLLCHLLLIIPCLHVQQARESQDKISIHNDKWRGASSLPQGASAHRRPSGKVWWWFLSLWTGIYLSHCVSHFIWALPGIYILVASDWSIQVTWPECWPLNAKYWLQDLITGLWLVKTDNMTWISASDWLIGMEAAETICEGMGELDGALRPGGSNHHYGLQAGKLGPSF